MKLYAQNHLTKKKWSIVSINFNALIPSILSEEHRIPTVRSMSGFFFYLLKILTM